MTKYEIIAEAHEGVFSVDEELCGIVEANSEAEALEKYAATDESVAWTDNWKCWLMNGARKIFAREKQNV